MCWYSFNLSNTYSFPWGNIHAKGEFVFRKYMLYFNSQHKNVICMHSSEVYYGIRINIGYTKVEVALTMKSKVTKT